MFGGRLFWSDESPGPFPAGSYELLRPIAVGTIGELDLARAHGAAGFIKPVIIKRLRPELTTEPSFRDVLARDSKLAVALRQASVVSMLDLSHDGIEMYAAIEFVAGVDIGAWLDAREANSRGPLPAPIVAYIGHRVLEALEAAHDIGLTHGDLRCHRILATPEGDVKVAGFGLSGATRFVNSGSATPAAPTDDLLAVGAALFEMLTLHAPEPELDGTTPSSASGDADLDAFVEAALGLHRSVHFQSATMMRNALRNALGSVIVSGRKLLPQTLEADAAQAIAQSRMNLRDASIAGQVGEHESGHTELPTRPDNETLRERLPRP